MKSEFCVPMRTCGEHLLDVILLGVQHCGVSHLYVVDLAVFNF